MEHKELKEQFKIRLSGVEDGNYCYSIKCNREFFELAKIADVEDGELDLRIEMEKSDRLAKLTFEFSGYVSAPCDRCLLPVRIPMDFENRLIVKLVAEPEKSAAADDDDIWIIDENTYELDVFHFVYESIFLALPLRIVHEDDENGNPTCDPDILRKMEELENAAKSSKENDPRWDALKKIITD
jgi:uncharacterized protein